jgi:hypothetical protein
VLEDGGICRCWGDVEEQGDCAAVVTCCQVVWNIREDLMVELQL